MSYVDFHLHSNHSDGSDAPARVAERAAELGIAAIALTDHDTVSGVPEAAAAAADLRIEFLPGVEISCRAGKQELHVLGLGVGVECDRLIAKLAGLAAERLRRAKTMVERLQALGVPVSEEAVRARAPDGVIGRMHLAQEVVGLGYAATVQEAFDKYIKAGRPAFVPKKAMSVAEAVEVIHEAGGLAFVAHPGLGDVGNRLPNLLKLPFDGIEVFHSKHTAAHVERFARIVEARGLLMTGGSDCHGQAKETGPLMGTVQTPIEVYDRILAAIA